MSVRVFSEADIGDLVADILQVGEKVHKHTIEKMRLYGEKIQREAIANAPVKDGFLHEAIKVEDRGGGRGAGGRFERKYVTVYVDPKMPGGPGGLPLIDYAYLMHEGLGPFGDYTYGAKGLNVPWRISSAEHDNGTGRVGGKFLERAIDLVAEEFFLDVEKGLE